MNNAVQTTEAPPRTGAVAGSSRLGSIDVSRGLVVVGSIVVTHLPADPPYGFTLHAEWFGLTTTDLMFPLFVALFGVGMSMAYRNGIGWSRMWQRSWRLALVGLVFNGIVGWDLTPATWRLTGVLQLFALAGVIVTVIAAVVGSKWWHVLLAGLAILAGYQLLLSLWATGCVDGLLAPGCNPSATVDPAVFTAPHVYAEGMRGYDPEGLAAVVGASGIALLGYAAGRILWRWRAGGAVVRLLAYAAGLGSAAMVVDQFVMPVSKRLWTPSFALVAGATTAVVLAVAHLLVDRLPAERPSSAATVSKWSDWLVAFGRNSLLIYFGRFVVDVVIANVGLGSLTAGRPIDVAVVDWLRGWSPHAPLTYLALTLAGWTTVAVLLHRRERYIRV